MRKDLSCMLHSNISIGDLIHHFESLDMIAKLRLRSTCNCKGFA